MESTILLNSNENTRQVEEEEKFRFVRSIFDSMGLPTEDIWDEEGELSVENKVKLRQVLLAYNIQIITNTGAELKIYYSEDGNNTLIGEWKKPQYILKKDYTQVDPKKKLYLEMKLSYWSIYENTE